MSQASKKEVQKQMTLQRENDELENHFPDVRTLLSWTAPGRPFRKRGREFYLSSLLIALPIEIIAFLFSQYLLMLAIAAIVFVSIVMSSVPPQNFHYRVSTEGISIEDHFYIWNELYDFYFKKVEGVDTLMLRTQDFIPGELRIPLGDISRDHVRKVLLQFLPYREMVRSTFMEKSGDWLAKTFPLESEKKE